MWFKRIALSKSRKKYIKKITRDKFTHYLKIGTLWLVAFGFFLLAIIYFVYIRPLPNINKLEEIDIGSSSVIYDREWNELYTLSGDEKRTYFPYENISQNMIHAIIAWEDKTFFQNSWIDPIGLIRAVLYRVIGITDEVKGTSTISQQLIKNAFLTNERSFERKIKEMYLSLAMNQNYSKEKILELYLNKISFWSNAFWVEQASRTFFGKSIKDVSVLEASILASIPKWPTYYSPYNHFDRLVGYLYTYPKNDENSQIKIIKKSEIAEYKDLVANFQSFLNGLKAERIWQNGIMICNLKEDFFKKRMWIDNDGCVMIQYEDLLSFLNNIRITSWENTLEYQTGRKDFILWRMLEDKYIEFDDYKKALHDSIGFEFKTYTEKIKAPHFVFFIKEYLENKYGADILEKDGLKIYTTLDPKLQEKAEELVKNQALANEKKFEANNAALISIDNTSGDIVAYVGGSDYFNKDIDGNVNMLNAKRQPWSSFKPFVYAIAIDKGPYWPLTPIYDVPTTFPGNYKPNNYNGQFSGKMTIMSALNASRNITAIKAYFLAWQQEAIIPYVKNMGIHSLDAKFYYGAPLALWAWEVKPIEMAQAYSVFANMGNKVDINPILKILDSKWLVIEEKKKAFGKRVMDEKVAYIMNSMLSNAASRPAWWNTNLTLKNRLAAAKTWTSNKQFVGKNGKKDIAPADLWTAWYTPDYTTIVWVGNTNGKAIAKNGDGLNGAAPIWKNFMEFAHSGKKASDWTRPSNLGYTKISKISWLLVPEWFDPNFVTETFFKNRPTKYDNSFKEIEVDMMCNGKVTENTPVWAIKRGYYIAFNSIDPTNAVWQKWVDDWVKNGGWMLEFKDIPNIITQYTDTVCERNETQVNNSNIKISSSIQEGETLIAGYNYIEVNYQSNNPLRSIQVLLWENMIQEIPLDVEKVGTFKGTINIPKWYDGNNTLIIRWVDSVFLSNEEVKNISITSKDTTPPEIILTNPVNGKIWVYSDQFFNLRWYVKDTSNIKSINLYIDGKPYVTGLTWREFIQEINRSLPVDVGSYTLKIEAVDFYFNIWSKEINLEILPR